MNRRGQGAILQEGAAGSVEPADSTKAVEWIQKSMYAYVPTYLPTYTYSILDSRRLGTV
jgi:hypothetical protein